VPEHLRRELRLLAVDRAEGKTTQAMAWLSNGDRVAHYPGWSRVLVVPNLQRVQHIRDQYWRRLEDFDHRVYSCDEWRRAQGVHHDVEVCIDDLDWFLGTGQPLAAFPGHIVCATMTAWPWEQQEFRERPRVVNH